MYRREPGEKEEGSARGDNGTQRGPLLRREGEFDQASLKKFKYPGVRGAGPWGMLKFRIQQQQLPALFEDRQVHTGIAKGIYNYGSRI